MRISIIKYAYMMSLLLMCIAIFVEKKIAFISGVFFGTSISSLMFYQMTISMKNASLMLPQDAQRYAASRYVFRMVIYAIAIVASIKSNYINEFATMAGLLSIKLAILFMTFTKKL